MTGPEMKVELPEMKANRTQETVGWIGMILVQCASFPSLYMLAMGHDVSLPDLSLVLLLMGGLAMYFWRALLQRDRIYLISNALGFSVQACMLSVIIYGERLAMV
jgi:hypothetical protein